MHTIVAECICLYEGGCDVVHVHGCSMRDSRKVALTKVGVKTHNKHTNV